MKVEKLALKLSMLLVIGLFIGGGIGCSDGSSGGSSDDENNSYPVSGGSSSGENTGNSSGNGDASSGGNTGDSSGNSDSNTPVSVSNSFLFYSQKWNYADDAFGVALPAKLELKSSIAAGDTLGSPFAEDAVAFCNAGVWGEDDTVIYYVDSEYALWSYSADGTKTLVKEAVAGATGAFVSYDSEGKCLFVLYDSDNTADQKLFVKDTVSGKSFTVVYGGYVYLVGDITAIAGSKKDSSFFIASGIGSSMLISTWIFSKGFSALLDEGLEVSSIKEAQYHNVISLGSQAPFDTEPLKKDPIQYKITDMTVLGGKLYALFASCFELVEMNYFPVGNCASAGGVLRINYSGNLSVDTTFGTDGVAGYSENIVKDSENADKSYFWLLPKPEYNVYERAYSTEWPTARINSNLEFNNPQKIIAIKPDELVIAENGLAITLDDNDNSRRKEYNLARAVTIDLNGKIKSVTAVHGKSFSYGGYNDTDGVNVSSSANNLQFE